MHFEILVEDQSGKAMLEILVPGILGPQHSCRIIAYKGAGRIAKGLKPEVDPAKRVLLDRLLSLLRGYARSLAHMRAAVIVVCDLDDRCLKAFRSELLAVLHACDPRPLTCFCIAIEEGEAWLLGDLPAVRAAYPKARERCLSDYRNDAVCGTWEVLADAVYPGGAAKLKAQGGQAVGAEKSRWAQSIARHMDPSSNRSPSFNYFRSQLQRLAAQDG
jgi:hypothetical protein